MLKARSILKTFYAMRQEEGVGAMVRRSIGVPQMRTFSPFLLLDHFDVEHGEGFPDHPHRGQETITKLMKGTMLHEDFTGKQGVLQQGDLQFMTAGKGVMHAEMPYAPDGGRVQGMQLWVDLPEKLKFTEPRYRDLRAKEIPKAKPNDKVEVNVVSGKSYGVESVKDLAYTPVEYYEYTVQPGGEFEQAVPEGFNTFIYLLDGELDIDGQNIPRFNAAFFKRDGDVIRGTVPEKSFRAAHFILVSGKVLDQPIVHYGPFVDTSKQGIEQAIADYQDAKNGFERASGWHSEIGRGVDEEIYKRLSSK